MKIEGNKNSKDYRRDTYKSCYINNKSSTIIRQGGKMQTILGNRRDLEGLLILTNLLIEEKKEVQDIKPPFWKKIGNIDTITLFPTKSRDGNYYITCIEYCSDERVAIHPRISNKSLAIIKRSHPENKFLVTLDDIPYEDLEKVKEKIDSLMNSSDKINEYKK